MVGATARVSAMVRVTLALGLVKVMFGIAISVRVRLG